MGACNTGWTGSSARNSATSHLAGNWLPLPAGWLLCHIQEQGMLVTPPICMHVSGMTQVSTCHIMLVSFYYETITQTFGELENRYIMCPPFAVGGAWQAALPVTACQVWADHIHSGHCCSPGWADQFPAPWAAAEVSREASAQNKMGSPQCEASL